uniref:Uncharacterized protein n=1 Tax=Vitis vinifera TaxID=29760 RepID=A5C8W7_VITVI|nr:hypothetical protein VITISV_025165 [Vitis vinifera]
MLSTPFSPDIINYEPPRGFMVPKFSTYDGTSDLFDHITHYKQLMTLDIGNDALLCKSWTSEAVHPIKGEMTQCPTTRAPTTSEAPRAIIDYIHEGLINEKYNSKRKRQRLFRDASVREQVNTVQSGLPQGDTRPIDGVITFPSVDLNLVLQPHEDALILTLGINEYDVRRILVNLGSSANLLQVSAFKQMGFPPFALENPERILSGFNGASTTSLGNIVLFVQARPVVLNVQFLIISSTYHQMISYLTEDEQINLYGSQLVACQCYQVA